MSSLLSASRIAALLWQFVRRGIETRYKGSHLGPLWLVLSPLLSVGLYLFIFGHIFEGHFGMPGETRTDYALALFTGLNLIQFISEIIATAPRAVLGSPNLVKKVVFPLAILPATTVGVALFNHLISMVLALIGIQLLGNGVSWHVLLWPLILLPVICLGLGLAFLLSSIGTYLRDIGHLTAFVTLVLLYTSAVFYPLSKVRPTPFWDFLKFNPLLHAVDLARNALVWHAPLNWTALIYVYVAGFAALGLGCFVFGKLRRGFADVL